MPRPLTLAFDLAGTGEFEMVLDVAKARRAHDVAGTGRDLHVAVGQLPRGVAAVGALPAVEAGAVEEDDRVGGGAVVAAGRYDRRGGPLVIVDAIGRVGKHRGIVVP